MAKGVVIGGGISGLVSACILAARGHDIVLLEKQPRLGGKLQEVQLDGYLFDLEPSMITMPWLFERVFREAGKTIDPLLRFIPLAVNSRNFFESGTVIDLTSDPDYMFEQLGAFSPENRQGFIEYLTEATRMYEVADENFFENPMLDWSDFFSFQWMKAFLSVYPFLTMDAFHKRFFDDPRLLAMMNRYATYVGSSPYRAPAALGFFAYLELVQGVYYVEGGNYRLIEAFERLAIDVGVKLFRSMPAKQIMVKQDKLFGVKTANHLWDADFVISSLDIATCRKMMKTEEKISIPTPATELSSSGFLCLFGINKKYKHLHHHNYFYPLDYSREFVDIFEQREWSLSPTLHVAFSGFSEASRAGKGSNLAVYVNVPAYNKQKKQYQANYYQAYRDFIVHWLETRWGFQGLNNAIEQECFYGPRELEALTGTKHAAIDRVTAGGIRNFFQPNPKDKTIKGLYYTDSSTHIGGGIAMSVIRALNTVQTIERDLSEKI
jgi:phytoene desaturase